jgi:chromosome segregation ATPase
MIKKMLLLAVVAAAGVFVLRHTKVGMYAKHEAAQLEEFFDSKVPFEKKIASLRKEVAGLTADADRLETELAGAIVDARSTGDQLKAETAALADEEQKVTALAAKIRGATEKVSYGRDTVSVDEAKQRLYLDVRRVQTQRKTVETLKATFVNREIVRDNLRKQLTELNRQKVALTAEIDGLEAEYRALQLKQMESKHQFDDTRLARIKEKLSGLKRDVNVQSELLNLKPTVSEDRAAGSPASGLSVDEIMAPLNGKKVEKAD